MSNVSEINQDLLLEFIDESLDGLAAAETLFIQLEAQPDNKDLVNAIFRPFHSMKGNSAYFGLMQVKRLSHKMENLLDAVRKGKIRADRSIISLLLPGTDLLRGMLELARTGSDAQFPDEKAQELIKQIDMLLTVAEKPEAMYEARLHEIADIINKISPAGLNKEAADALRAVHNKLEQIPLKKVSPASNIAPEIEVLEQFLKKPFVGGSADAGMVGEIKKKIEALPALSSNEKYLAAVEDLKGVLDVFLGAGLDIDNLARELMLDKTEIVSRIYGEFSTVKKEASAEKKETGTEASAIKKTSEKTMRIAQSSLDGFLDNIGELLEIEEIFRYQLRNISETMSVLDITSTFRQSIDQLSQTSHTLLTSVMDIRKIEAGVLLNKVPRLVRDVADSTGKKIQVKIAGEDISVDKSYLDLLDAPLTHMVRNAADHGIELPVKRKEAGKNEDGLISVEMEATDEHVRLKVSDNGAGLNFPALRKKAIDLGFISAEEKLSEQALVNLLFMSGVSTAEKITDVSGRGVGMDVVKRCIDAVGGEITVTSEPGKGSEFTVSLPANVNTKIVDGCVVKASNSNTFVIPMKIVEESFPEWIKNICRLPDEQKVLKRRGAMYKTATIDELLGLENKEFISDETMQSFILLKSGIKKFILQVDTVIGVQKIVVKPLDVTGNRNNRFEGAAILGDGSVALILDSEWIMSNVK